MWDVEDEWIDEMDGIYENILRKRIAYLKVIEDAQKENENQQKISEEQETQLRKQEADRAVARAEQSCKVEEATFNQEVENLKITLDLEAEKSKPAISMVETAINELQKQLEQCKKSHSGYVTLLEPEKVLHKLTGIASFLRIYSQMSQRIGEIIFTYLGRRELEERWNLFLRLTSKQTLKVF